MFPKNPTPMFPLLSPPPAYKPSPLGWQSTRSNSMAIKVKLSLLAQSNRFQKYILLLSLQIVVGSTLAQASKVLDSSWTILSPLLPTSVIIYCQPSSTCVTFPGYALFFGLLLMSFSSVYLKNSFISSKWYTTLQNRSSLSLNLMNHH